MFIYDLKATLRMYLSLAIVSDEIKWSPYLIFKRSSNSTKVYVLFVRNGEKISNKELSLISKVSEESIQNLKYAAEIRTNLADTDECLLRVNQFLQEEPKNNKWHKSCYSSFTHKNKIVRLKSKENSENGITLNFNNETSMRSITHSKIPSFQWDRCAFCKENNKKDLHRVS